MNKKRVCIMIILSIIGLLFCNIQNIKERMLMKQVDQFNQESVNFIDVTNEISNELTNINVSNSTDYTKLLTLQNKLNDINFDNNTSTSNSSIDFTELINDIDDMKNTENNIINLTISKTKKDKEFVAKFKSLSDNLIEEDTKFKETYMNLLKENNYVVSEKEDGSFVFSKETKFNYFIIF